MFLCAFFAVLMLATAWPLVERDYHLSKDGSHITGTSWSKACGAKHSTIEYKFLVGSTEYRGTGSLGRGNQGCSNFQTGDQVFVTYLSGNPEINVPSREVDSNIALTVFFVLTISASLAWVNTEQSRFLGEKRKRQRKKNA